MESREWRVESRSGMRQASHAGNQGDQPRGSRGSNSSIPFRRIIPQKVIKGIKGIKGSRKGPACRQRNERPALLSTLYVPLLRPFEPSDPLFTRTSGPLFGPQESGGNLCVFPRNSRIFPCSTFRGGQGANFFQKGVQPAPTCGNVSGPSSAVFFIRVIRVIRGCLPWVAALLPRRVFRDVCGPQQRQKNVGQKKGKQPLFAAIFCPPSSCPFLLSTVTTAPAPASIITTPVKRRTARAGCAWSNASAGCGTAPPKRGAK